MTIASSRTRRSATTSPSGTAPRRSARFPFPSPRTPTTYSVNHRAAHRWGPSGSCFEFPSTLTNTTSPSAGSARVCWRRRGAATSLYPHMMSAQWDVVELILTSLARDYPEHFHLERAGSRGRWRNDPLGPRGRVHLRRPRDAALRAAGVRHPPGARRLVRPRPARGNPVDGRRHGHDPGRLVAQLRPRHEL